ncbi:hypothetical protein J6590_103287 [Homalodisca vitripennis]|nr:hypothetical protein J6590_103287 [Homalodisca vitripennis]
MSLLHALEEEHIQILIFLSLIFVLPRTLPSIVRKKKLSSLRTGLAISQGFFGNLFNFNNVSVGDPKSLHSPGTSSPVTSSSESKVPGGEYLDVVHAFLLRKLCRWAQAITTFLLLQVAIALAYAVLEKQLIKYEFSTTRLPLEWRPLKIVSLVPRVNVPANLFIIFSFNGKAS